MLVEEERSYLGTEIKSIQRTSISSLLWATEAKSFWGCVGDI